MVIPEVVVFAQVATIATGLVGAMAGIGWTIYRKAHLLNNAPPPGRNDVQLEQLQQSIDAIAVEVERIAEAQRFSAKLLSERVESQSGGSLGR